MPRERLKEEACLEASYDRMKRLQREETLKSQANRSQKKNLSVFGYKYSKVLKFVAQTIRCLKDCHESKFEQLNVDMNYFLLLKNELSLAFLRKFENLISTVKAAIRIYAS